MDLTIFSVVLGGLRHHRGGGATFPLCTPLPRVYIASGVAQTWRSEGRREKKNAYLGFALARRHILAPRQRFWVHGFAIFTPKNTP